MRKLSYLVKKNDGTIFETASYFKATEEGNRILSSILTEIDEVPESYKKKMKIHAEKIAKLLKSGKKLHNPKY